MNHLYEFSAPGKNLPRSVRDGDPHGRRLRHGGSVALGGSAALVQYRPTRREYFVRSRRLAGARPYCETLYYEDCGSAGCTPQYAGNISRMVHSLAHGNTDYSETRDVVYAYDLMNRLTNVNDADIDDFDETFAYDPQGRMTAQRRGANVTAASGGEYGYYAGTNRLEKVSSGMGGTADDRHMGADSNFVYDRDGNMTYDASKNMTVTYDWRGLPTEFVREVPSATGIVGEVDTVRLLMTYDGSGSRIGKRYERRNAGDTAWALQLATHYTGLGSEIRENGLDKTARVVVSLPQGLGRYGVESASESVANAVPSFEYYLKNHLGSTMLVYGVGASQGVRAAYDYRAFGEQVDLAVPTDKVTENFTGKELDDETSLGYWGARYLDQMLGLWIAVDTKRQFASPYLYVGNGANSIKFFDDDGNEIYLANNQQQLLGYINQASYNQYTVDKNNMLVSAGTCNENGNKYYSERLDAAIGSDQSIYARIRPDLNDVTGLLEDNSLLVTITGQNNGNSSPAQNLLHEFVSHAIPILLNDRSPWGSAMQEEQKAIEGVFPVQEDIPDHLIDERME